MTIRQQDIPSADEAQAVRDAAAPAGKRKRWWRWPLRLGVPSLLLLIAVVAAVPTLLSTGPGTAWLVGRVNADLPGRLAVDDLRLRWLSGQAAAGVELWDPDGRSVGTVGKVELPDTPLWRLLLDRRRVGSVVIESLDAEVSPDDAGRVNVDRALGTGWFVSSDDGAVSGGVSDAAWPAVRVVAPTATLSLPGTGDAGLTLDATLTQGGESGRVVLAAAAQRLLDSRGGLRLSDASFDIEGSVEALPVSALDRVLAGGGRLPTLLGPVLDAELSLKGPTSALDGELSVTSDRLNVRQSMRATDDRLVAADGSDWRWELTPAGWRALAGPDAAALAEPVTLRFAVARLDAPRGGDGLDFSQTAYELRLDAEDDRMLRWALPERGEISVQPRLILASDSASQRAKLVYAGRVTAFGQTGQPITSLAVRRGEAGWSQVSAEGEIKRLPVPLLDGLLGQGGRLTATFGQLLEGRLEAAADGEGGYSLTADLGELALPYGTPDLDSDPVPRFTGRFTGTYAADGALSLTSDGPLRLRLTPEAFDAWQRPVAQAAEMGESVGLSLPEATTVEADVDLQLALAGGDGLRFDPERTKAVATFTLPETVLEDRWYHRRFTLREGRLVVDAPDLRRPVTARLDVETDAAGTGTIAAEARVEGLVLDDGYVQVENGRLSAEVELADVPTVVFDTLARQRGYAIAAFGDRLSLDAAVDDWSLKHGGNYELSLESANGSMGSFRGADRDGMLVPDGPVTFHLNQTPELASKLMRFVNPVLLPAVRSANVPFTVTIDDDNFRLPTRGFALGLLDADVRVQMGTVTISPEVEPVGQLVRPLRRVGLLDGATTYEAKTSPIDLRIRGGVLGYERLSFRIDDVTLDFGGTISLVDQNIDLGLSIGGKEVERNPVLRELARSLVKIGGTVDAPEVNLSLLAGLSGDRLPETIGGILGGVLDRELRRQRGDEPRRDEPPADNESSATERDLGRLFGGLIGEAIDRERRRSQPDDQQQQE